MAATPEPPEIPDELFPPYVNSDAEKLRWRLSLGIARELMGEDDSPTVWQMTRTIYNDPERYPTEDPSA